jgi:hypothetical protein
MVSAAEPAAAPVDQAAVVHPVVVEVAATVASAVAR